MPRLHRRGHRVRQLTVRDLDVTDIMALRYGPVRWPQPASELRSLDDLQATTESLAAIICTMRTSSDPDSYDGHLQYDPGERLWAWWQWLSPEPRNEDKFPEEVDQLRHLGLVDANEEAAIAAENERQRQLPRWIQ